MQKLGEKLKRYDWAPVSYSLWFGLVDQKGGAFHTNTAQLCEYVTHCKSYSLWSVAWATEFSLRLVLVTLLPEWEV